MIEPARSTRRRIKVIRRLVAWLIIAIVAIAALTITNIEAREAVGDSQRAAMRAKAVATCVNKVLGARNQPTQDETDALKAYASVNSLFINALGAVLLDPKAKQAGDYTIFLTVLRQAETEGAQFKAALDKVEAERAQKPLGAC